MTLAIPLGPVMTDVAGLRLEEADCRRLAHPLVGGVILFARNFESPTQVKALTAEIRALRAPELLVCVDHEGGRVQRFREGFTAIPPSRKTGKSNATNNPFDFMIFSFARTGMASGEILRLDCFSRLQKWKTSVETENSWPSLNATESESKQYDPATLLARKENGYLAITR